MKPGSPTLLADSLPSESPRKPRNSRKTSTFASMLKPLTEWITTNCGKFLKRWEYQTTLPASWEICNQSKKQQLDLNVVQWTGSKLVYDYLPRQGDIKPHIRFQLASPGNLQFWKWDRQNLSTWSMHQSSRLPPVTLTVGKDDKWWLTWGVFFVASANFT